MVIIITIEQKGDKNLLLFDRDINNNRTITEVTDFVPYFYIEDFLAGEFTTLYGEKCRKIFTNSSKDVVFERTKYNKVYEADIHYTDRFIIDKIQIPIPKRNLRKCFLDIENDDSLDVINTPRPITCITCYDNYLNKSVTLVYKHNIEVKQEKNHNNSIYYFNSESDLLNTFIKFITDTDPDLLIGFNVNFDLSYIINRCKKLFLKINQISPMNYTKIDKYGVKVYGRVVLDMRKLLKRNFIKKELFSYSLNEVAKHLIGRGKQEIKELPGQLWRNDLQKLITYNIEDVMLLKEIDDKFNVIEFYDTLRRRVGCSWERLTSFSYLHDMETYRKGKEMNYVIPKTDLKEYKKADGGFVQEPIKGLFSFVINLDIKSQYPYAILSANISPETLDDNGDITIEKNLRFKSYPIGLIPSIINDEMNHRDEMKKLMNEELKKNGKTTYYNSLYLMQYANKVLMNSYYGLFNTEFYVLKERRITEAITSFARQSIQWSKDIVEKEGYKVTYIDTDGIYIDSKCNDLQETIKLGKYLQQKINESYKDFLLSLGIKNGHLEIKFENIYNSFFIGSKKHYFGHLCWNEDNEVDEMVIKGYEVIRVDTAKVCKEMMDEVFKMILYRKSKEEIDKYISELKKNLINLDITEIGIPKPYKKENKVKTAHFKAVQFSNRYLLAGIQEGERILYVYGHIKGLPETEAFAFNPNKKEILKDKQIIIDWKRMINVLIDLKIKRLYSALNWQPQKKSVSLKDYMERQEKIIEYAEIK